PLELGDHRGEVVRRQRARDEEVAPIVERRDLRCAEGRHDQASAAGGAPASARRGSSTTNSVNSPGRASKWIAPPCRGAAMSWLMESPSPTPSGVGLVVKNGLKILSRTPSGMPEPLSRTRISSLWPRSLVVTSITGENAALSASHLSLVAYQ